MAGDARPIGIFDSGVGGLSIAAAVHQLLPPESILYYADRAHFPYGSRTEEEVVQFAVEATQFLTDHGAKLVVVACNSASSTALSRLRATFSIPFVGVVPGVKPGSSATQSSKVGILATEATFQSKVFADLVEQFAGGVEVVCQVCPDLVALVESGIVKGKRLEQWLHQYIDPLVSGGVDTLVLGCTHYAFLSPLIQRVAGPGVTVIDTSVPVARQVQRVLQAQDLLNRDTKAGQVTFFASMHMQRFMRIAAKLWPQGVENASLGRGSRVIYDLR